MIRSVAAALMITITGLAVAACDGSTTGATNVTATTARLWANSECDQLCTAYLQYRQVGTTAWTPTAKLTNIGRVNPAVSWFLGVSGLSPETEYEYQLCGQESTWSGPVCVGPEGGPATQTFTTAPASTFGTLSENWSKSYDTWPYAARAVVNNGTVYIGSWDGYERAFDESGNLKWATDLGQTTSCTDAIPGGLTQGVTSAPAIDPSTGDLYLADGTNNFDALDPNTGQILWSVPTDTAPGNYNWSSPVIYNGHAYIGTASMCDDPLVQGQLLSINLTTHQVDGDFKVVPDGQIGGGVWTSPVVDPSTGTVFITTGNGTSASQTYAESIIALDANTLAVKGSWQIPGLCTTTCADLDWGTTPTLMTDSAGDQLIAAAAKNGYLYAFNRNDLSAGPIWQDQIASSAGGPQSGQGSVSNGVFDGTNLYFAGGNTTIGGQSYTGSVRAINPATGAYVWQQGLPGVPLAALSQANGEIVAPTYNGSGPAGLFLLNSASGNIDYANAGSFFSPPTVADGLLFEGDVDGNFNVYTFPSAPGQAAAKPQVSSTPTIAAAPAMPRTQQRHAINVP